MQALSGKKARVNAIREPDTRLKKVKTKKERSAAARKSKTKGSSYERRIAKRFSAWSGERLSRTPQSGGWHGAGDYGVAGDLVCARKSFPFHIECKKREGWHLEDLIIGVRSSVTSNGVLAWWAQTLRTCPPNKLPTLIFARNHMPDLIMMRRVNFQKLCGKNYFTAEFIPHYTFALDSGEVVILSLDDFFAKVRPPKGCRGRKTWTPTPLDS